MAIGLSPEPEKVDREQALWDWVSGPGERRAVRADIGDQSVQVFGHRGWVASGGVDDLRHGAAPLMIGGGASLSVVSEVLQHSSIAITQSTYVHLLSGVGRGGC